MVLDSARHERLQMKIVGLVRTVEYRRKAVELMAVDIYEMRVQALAESGCSKWVGRAHNDLSASARAMSN